MNLLEIPCMQDRFDHPGAMFHALQRFGVIDFIDDAAEGLIDDGSHPDLASILSVFAPGPVVNDSGTLTVGGEDASKSLRKLLRELEMKYGAIVFHEDQLDDLEESDIEKDLLDLSMFATTRQKDVFISIVFPYSCEREPDDITVSRYIYRADKWWSDWINSVSYLPADDVPIWCCLYSADASAEFVGIPFERLMRSITPAIISVDLDPTWLDEYDLGICDDGNGPYDAMIFLGTQNAENYARNNMAEHYPRVLKALKTCKRCGAPLFYSFFKDQEQGYAYQCFACEEDFFACEQ